MSWLPLESNPDVMNQMLEKFGVPKKWQVVDVYSLDDDLLATVPQPTVAVILLFPTAKSEKFKADDSQKEESKSVPDGVAFIKQFIHNACGTIALIHSVINNTDKIDLQDGPLKTFVGKTKGLTPEEAGKVLMDFEGIKEVHDDTASEGQTEAPPADSDVDFHFVTFVEKNGGIYELDGRQSAPIKVQDSKEDNLLKDAASAIKEYMKRDPTNIQFTVLALSNVE